MCGANENRITSVEIVHNITSDDVTNQESVGGDYLIKIEPIPKPPPLLLSSNDLYLLEIELATIEDPIETIPPYAVKLKGLYAPYLTKIRNGKQDYNREPTMLFNSPYHSSPRCIIANPFDKNITLAITDDWFDLHLSTSATFNIKLNFVPIDELDKMKKF